MHKRLFNNTLLLSIMVCTVSLNANTSDLLASISSEIKHFDKVATITKENEHYQPYIVSVFNAKELEKLGVVNLKEALGLVPGIDMATDNVNTQTPIFRGSNPLASGQSKLFIDGTLVNNVFFDAYSEYLSLPIDMIKRIEVVRGPGSKTNGVNAYAGSINVITYSEDFEGFESKDKIIFKAGSNKYKMGGFIKTFKTEDFKLFMDFFYQEDDKKLPAGPDGYATGSMSIDGLFDNTDLAQNGDAPLWLKNYSLGINFNYGDFSIKSRLFNHTQGSAYGINLSLPQDDDRVKIPNHFLELEYSKKIHDFELDIKAGMKYDSFDSKTKIGPDGINFMDMVSRSQDGIFAPVTFTNGIYGEHLATQRTLYQSSYLKYNAIDNHIITAGYRFVKEETIDMVSKLSNWSTGEATPFDYTDIYPFFDKNAKRNITIFSLQDEFKLNNNFNFIYGFNYEQTSYKDAGFDPRVSMVYQPDAENIFKAIYSRSHRNASWQEMYTMNNHSRVGSTNLEPEQVNAFELAYIKKLSSDTYLQSNLFYLLNKNQIYNSSANPEYRNVVDTDIYGLEFEYKGNTSSKDQIYVNYSYVKGDSHVKDANTDEPISNVANHLVKGYYIYNIYDNLSISGIAKYVGSKKRAAGDTREDVDAYSTIDTSLQYRDLDDDYTVSLSIKNIFNANIKYPSPPKTYIEDYEQERRNFFVSLKKEF